jgi:hypothetical protein
MAKKERPFLTFRAGAVDPEQQREERDKVERYLQQKEGGSAGFVRESDGRDSFSPKSALRLWSTSRLGRILATVTRRHAPRMER